MKKLYLIALFLFFFLAAFVLAKNAIAYKCASLNGTCMSSSSCSSGFICTVAEDCTGSTTCCCAPTCSSLGGECKDSCGSQTDLGGTGDCTKKCCNKAATTAPSAGATGATGTGTGGEAFRAPAGGGAIKVDIGGIMGLGTISPSTLIGNIIKTVLSIVGALALLMVVYGGMILLTSRGGEGVKKGKDILIWATIGVAIVLGSYALVSYVITGITGGGTTTTGGGGTSPTTTTPKSCLEAHPTNATCGSLPCRQGYTEDTTNLCTDKTLKCCYSGGAGTGGGTTTPSRCLATVGGNCREVTPCNIANPNDVVGCAKYLQDSGVYKSCTITTDCNSANGRACCVNK